ncbi:16513_t:CDS:2, partial [Dentiscutata erythropus]
DQNEVEYVGWQNSTSNKESIIYKELLTYNRSSESAVLNPFENNFSSMQITPEYENRSEDSQETITKDNTSATISCYFSGYNGYTVDDTINKLVSSKLKPKDLPVIRVCIIERQFFSANNKRLYCYQKAIKNNANFKKVPVKIVRETDERAGFKWKIESSLIVLPKQNWQKTMILDHARA